MQARTIIAVLAVSLLAGGLISAAGSYEEMIDRAEQLWMQDKYVESNRVLEEIIRLYPDKAEPYWRQARNNYDILEDIPREQKPGKDVLIEKYREVERLGSRCEELAPQDGNCYLWHSIGMGRRGTTQGVLNSLGEIDDMEGLLLKAIDLKPPYRAENGVANAMGDAYNAIGQFYRVVPDWRFLQWVFGAKGDIDKSVEYQRKAVEREPDRIEYIKEFGVSLVCRGRKTGSHADVEEGKKQLERIAGLPSIKPSDMIDKQHAKDLIADPDLACGYSRDAQQEVSREAYDREQEK